ncbi:MAG: ABC transporter permease [Cyclobacteriaceae bacterium]
MLRNYIKIAWRNLVKHKVFTTINIFSLSIGVSACLIIFLFVSDELSFDAFHKKKDQIYRLCEVQSFPGTNTQNVALTMPGMAPTMLEEFDEIENYARFWKWGERLVEIGETKILIDEVAGADSSFFEIFDYELIHGDPATVIDEPFDVVVSEDVALRLFDRTDVVGESFDIGGDHCHVKGVMKNVPENSHLQFSMLLNIKSATTENPDFDSQFGNNYLNTYFVLNPNANLDEMAERFPNYMIKSSGDEEINDYYKLFLQPLDEVHLTSTNMEHDYNNHRKFNGTYIDVFILVGIFILIIAAVNFMNLTVARAGTRAQEIGVRKTIGAIRGQLFKQFTIESVLLSVLALLLVILIVSLCLPLLNQLIDRQLSLSVIWSDPVLMGIIILAIIVIGVLAGLYPSIYLSSFKPIAVLKGIKALEKKSFLRSAMVVVQFSLALGMIICTLIVVQQLNFIKNKDIGFDKDHMVLISLNQEAAEQYEDMKTALLKESNVLGVTASGQRIGNNFHQWGFKVLKDTITGVTPSNVFVDYNYLDVYGIKLLEGRGFSKDYATDDGLAFVINESFADELGFEDPIGQPAGHAWYPDDSLGTIIGVTEDFNFNSLHYKVNTLSMVVHTEWTFNEMSVKVNGENVAQAINDIEKVYGQFVSDYPFKYEFLDDHFAELYKSDEQMGSVVTIMAILSIFIGCMGLFGLASISIERRIKEIGIRKTLGASVFELLTLLSGRFIRMIVISFVLASPLTFLFLKGWLENFAFRIEINPLIFMIGGVIALIIALITVSYHVVRAALSNPIDALEYE